MTGLYEKAIEYRITQDDDNQRYFKEYKHDEPVDVASKKIESKLKEQNPKSVVVRHDESSFTLVHPGGHLITNVDTVKGRHYVTTTYVPTTPKDLKMERGEVIKNGSVLYESIDMEYVVHDENGHVYFHHKNLYQLRQSLARLQSTYFKIHHRRRNPVHHRFFISSRRSYMNRFGRRRLYENVSLDYFNETLYENLFVPNENAYQIVKEAFSQVTEFLTQLDEGYKDNYVVEYSHVAKGTGKRMNKTMRINFAIDEEHAKRIASKIAAKRKLKGFRISTKKKPADESND